MSQGTGLDLSGLAQFRASNLVVSHGSGQEPGRPVEVALSLIDFDPAQPRRTFDVASIAELAASIAAHGVLEPVSLRTRADAPGRFIVNRGERRVRAAMQAGLSSVPAFLDDRIDPYAQAVENLHREDMSPFDLANFIAEREKDGHTRAEIARRLNKSRSFVTEAASLIDAPAEVRQAFDAGRLGSDARSLYQLALALKRRPVEATALLQGESIITRANLDTVLGRSGGEEVRESGTLGTTLKSSSPPSAGRTVLVVEHAGRRGSLRLKAHDTDVAEVGFGDGSRDLIRLQELRLVCWATEE